MPTPTPTPKTPAAPAPARSAATSGLADTLTKLREVLQNIAQGNPAGAATAALGGGGAVAVGGFADPTIAAARAGLLPVQALVRQIQQATADTSTAFTASMGRVRGTWQQTVGGFAGDFLAAFRGTTRRRKGRGIAAGRAARQAHRAALDHVRRRTTAARREARSWAKAFTRATTRVARRRSAAAPGSSRRPRGRSPLARSLDRVVKGLGRWRGRTARTWTRSARRATQRTRRRAASWSRSARRKVAGWSRSARRATRNWTRRATRAWKGAKRTGRSWANSARRSWKGAKRSARRRWQPLQRRATRWRKRTGRRAAVAWRQSGRQFARTGSVGHAARAGARAVAGRAVANGASGVSTVLSALSGVMNAMQRNFEGQNESNRHLARFSPVLSQAFAQLSIGDMQREMKLARATEGSAATLAGVVNRSREIQGGFDRLGAGISNRVSSALGGLWNGLTAPYSMAADAVNDAMNAFDPKGNLLARIAVSPFSLAAGGSGFVASYLTNGFNFKDALGEAQRAFDKQEGDLLGGVVPTLDPWANFLQGAQNMKPIRPMKEVKF